MTATSTAPPEAVGVTRTAVDGRRVLQLGLAAVWLLDGVLQYQSWMFTKAFGQMLAAAADGNPAVIASPITWDAHLVEHYPVLLNAVFGTIQLLLGLGIAWRPTVRVALAASIAWALGVWWLGEGLGGVLATPDSAVAGGPGAVILYAVAAVLLWPRRGSFAAPFVAARAVGAPVAKALWLVLWGSMAVLQLLPVNRAPQGVHDDITAMAAGEPHWLAALVNATGSLTAHRGLAFSIGLAVVFGLLALGVYLPPPAVRVTVSLAVLVGLVIWIPGQAFGGILAGGMTDPNSGPLLVLIALAYWRPRLAAQEAPTAPSMETSMVAPMAARS
jgi:hypothetical protein